MHVLDLFKLDGKITLVTGCRGIGKAMAAALAEAVRWPTTGRARVCR